MIMWRSDVVWALRSHDHHLIIIISLSSIYPFSNIDDVTIRDVIIIMPRGRAAREGVVLRE